MEQVAEHYGIPSISLGVFANDGVHPRPEGHALYLEAVKQAFAAMDGAKPVDHASRLATPFVPDNWEAAKVFPVTADVLRGDWAPDPERPGTFMTHTPGASLKFSFAGSVLRLRMCYQPDGGIMSAKIDGKPVADVVGFDQYSTYVRGGSVTLYDGAGGVWFGADGVRLAKGEKHPVARREIFGYHPRANAFNVLEDCVIRDGGRYNAMGTGVVIGHASDCRVEHCEIADFYYSGVSVGWQWAYLPTAAMRNIVRFNRIHDLGKGVLSDMGGVYTLGTAFGTCVTDNGIYNVSSRTYGGWGLYADEGSEGIVFARNLVYNTHDGGFHQHYGAGNTVQNNIFAWNEQNGVIRTIRANVFSVRSSLNVVANIVLTDRGDLASAGVRGVEGVWANNLWFDPNGEAKLDGLTWEKWRACGKEVNGRYADPRFVDARHFDFRLKPDSPAFALGFQPFDYTRAGVRADR